MTPQRRAERVSACAIQWLHEVLPLVPVTPTIHSRASGCRRRRLAISPACRLQVARRRRSARATSGASGSRARSHSTRAAPRAIASRDEGAPVARLARDTRRTCRPARPRGCRSRAASCRSASTRSSRARVARATLAVRDPRSSVARRHTSSLISGALGGGSTTLFDRRVRRHRQQPQRAGHDLGRTPARRPRRRSTGRPTARRSSPRR